MLVNQRAADFFKPAFIRCKVATPSLLRKPFPVRARIGSAAKRSCIRSASFMMRFNRWF